MSKTVGKGWQERLLGSGLEDNLYNLLSRIREECKGKYVLFPKKKLLGACGGETVTEEELNVYIDSLAAAGYLDKKYADNDVVLLKPLGKSLTASRDEKPAPQEVISVTDGGTMSEFLRFIIAFLGGFSGALAGMVVFALLC